MRRFCSSKFLLCLYVFGMTAVLAAQPPYRDGRRTTPLRTITVTSEPRAKVWIDGVFYGRTDGAGSLTIRSIASGGHTIRVRADGFKERSLPLAAIQKGEIKVPLVKTTDEAELAFQEAERLSFVDREKAVEAYRRAIRLRPNFPDAYLSMSRVLMDAGDVDAAMKAILAARRLRPGFAEASAVEGRILKESGEETKAIVAFRRAIAEGRGFQPEAYTGLGMLYKEKAEGFGGEGDFANEDANYIEAAKHFQTALKQLSGAPDAIVLYQLLGLIYERQKKTAEAIAVYEDFLRFFPDAPEATAVRSFIVQLKKDQIPKP
jgi:tetratricopeptide (TPR) repeat protein